MFYKVIDGEFIGTPYVLGTNLILVQDNKDQFEYPVEGWYWFDTEEEARTFFNVEPE